MFQAGMFDPNGNLAKFNNPFAPYQSNSDVKVYIENKGWVEQIGEKLLGWLDTQKEQFVAWVIPAAKNFACSILDQGVTLFQVGIVFMMIFYIYKIIASHQLEDAISKTYLWGIVFVLTVFFKAVCLGV